MSKQIIIDAYQDTSKITGTDRMAFNFLRELQAVDSVNRYTIICSNERYIHDIVTSQNFKIVKPPLNFQNRIVKKIFNYVWRRSVNLKLFFKRPDVYFSFHNMRLPKLRLAKKMIASNLDLIPIILDEYKGTGRHSPEKQFKKYTQVAHVADKFISISEFSKQELIKHLGVEPSKIEVVHLAADIAFSQKKQSSQLINQLSGNYIFTMGGSEPRKNVQTIIEAYQLLPSPIKATHKLAIAGGKWQNHTLKNTEDKNIIELGYFHDSDLPAAYSNASVFVFASKYEGFGFTILEAMASGTPVINAKGSSLEEVAGNASLSFDPDDPKELTQQLTKLLIDKTLQTKLRKLGLEQNKRFSWKKSGKEFHRILTEG